MKERLLEALAAVLIKFNHEFFYLQFYRIAELGRILMLEGSR